MLAADEEEQEAGEDEDEEGDWGTSDSSAVEEGEESEWQDEDEDEGEVRPAASRGARAGWMLWHGGAGWLWRTRMQPCCWPPPPFPLSQPCRCFPSPWQGNDAFLTAGDGDY